jgi:hypothetical protein
LEDFLIRKVMHAAGRQTVYIVGHQVYKDQACPIPRILVPVDGSPYSMKGVEHAACLAGNLADSLRGITILRVGLNLFKADGLYLPDPRMVFLA